MNRESITPIVACFYRKPDNTYELNQLYTLENPRPGTLGALFGRIRMYDVDWCKRDWCYLFHQSGSGGRLPIEIQGPYWSRSKYDVKEEPCTIVNVREYRRNQEPGPETRRLREWNRTRRLFELPLDPDDSADIFEWLECNGRQQEAVYCSICKDHLPDDDLCGHCWWCDSVGMCITPDEGKVCFDPDCWGCSRRRRARHERHRNNKRYERFQRAMEALHV